jgi:hypothetical protein
MVFETQSLWKINDQTNLQLLHSWWVVEKNEMNITKIKTSCHTVFLITPVTNDSVRVNQSNQNSVGAFGLAYRRCVSRTTLTWIGRLHNLASVKTGGKCHRWRAVATTFYKSYITALHHISLSFSQTPFIFFWLACIYIVGIHCQFEAFTCHEGQTANGWCVCCHIN